MVMIMSTYRHNYLRAPNYPSEIIFAVPSRPMSLSKLVYETSSEPMTSPPRTSMIYHDVVTKLVYVLQI